MYIYIRYIYIITKDFQSVCRVEIAAQEAVKCEMLSENLYTTRAHKLYHEVMFIQVAKIQSQASENFVLSISSIAKYKFSVSLMNLRTLDLNLLFVPTFLIFQLNLLHSLAKCVKSIQFLCKRFLFSFELKMVFFTFFCHYKNLVVLLSLQELLISFLMRNPFTIMMAALYWIILIVLLKNPFIGLLCIISA